MSQTLSHRVAQMPWLLAAAAIVVSATPAAVAALPPPPVPPQNPITEPKRILGKILFWDAQLSSDNTTACGTCHIPAAAGGDPRFGVNPGLDGVQPSPDDVFGSIGVIRSDSSDAYSRDQVFGLRPQVTRRDANPPMMAAYAASLFWDGRATGTFTDPISGAVVIPQGGALESQAIAPLVSDVEMAHEDRDWSEITDRLAAARPLALATDLPPDMASAVDANPSYPELFQAAFGDPQITPVRIAFAIATYERTLLPDQTPWDAFIAGNPNAMTPQQVAGWNAFNAAGARCNICHVPPFFTNNTFRNIGLRPPVEDEGRFEVTGDPIDRGRFKVPSLRNVGVKTSFMHTGRLGTLEQVLDFYLGINGQVQFPQNQDPLIPVIFIPVNARPALIEFLRNGLTDPRIAAEQFPFDRPTLHSEMIPPNPLQIGAGTPGSSGQSPIMIAVVPPNLGNEGFKIGVTRALGGAQAFIAMSSTPPDADGRLDPDGIYGPVTLEGGAAADGYGTFFWPIPDSAGLIGQTRYFQWIIADPGATGGQALSPVAQATIFCNSNCPCPGDFDGDHDVDTTDLNVVLSSFGCGSTQCPGDVDGDGDVDTTDLNILLSAFGNGC